MNTGTKHLKPYQSLYSLKNYMLIKDRTEYFKIGLFNAGSLRTRHEEFLEVMADIMFDLIAINETWIREGEEDLAPVVPGYRLRHKPRPADIRSGRGGGVGFYVKKGLKVKICDHPHLHSVEQMWIEIKTNGKRVVVGTAYRPPWQDVNMFLDALTQSVTYLSDRDNIVLLGDFNINLINQLENKSKLFNDFTHYINLSQIVTEPTHFTDHSETLIDLICTDAKVRQVTVKHIPELGNHAVVTATLNMKKEKIKPRWIMTRPLKDIDLQQFNQDLNDIPWRDINVDSDINSMVTSFNNSILNIFDLHAPRKKILIKEQQCPWITSTIKSMIKLRNASHVRYKSTQKDSHKLYYKDLKKTVSEAMEAEKRAYYKYHINIHIKNPLVMWKHLKSFLIINNKKDQELPTSLSNPEIINRHFLEVPHRDAKNLSTYTFFEFHRFGPGTFDFALANEMEILKIIKTLKTNATGVDEMSLEMLMLTLPQSLTTITNMVNRAILTSTFPDAWKTAIVKPLPKIDNPSTLKDLRPISILPCISKILEKVLCSQMTKYIEESNILPVFQSGFRKNHSTSTAIIDVVDNILTAQDQGMGTILILLDYSRAFDSINTSLLLSKLSFYGFSNRTVHLFDNYFKNREQLVQICQTDGHLLTSTPSPVLRGVPQGSILSPLLFALYTADMVNCIKHCKYHLYADDVQLYYSFQPSDTTEAISKISQDLANIASWSESNSLMLNPQKSKLLILGTKGIITKIETYDTTIKIGNNAVERIYEVRNLGVIFDSNLHFETHIKTIVKNCLYRLKVIYKMRPYLGTDVRIRLCEALILSKLNYADTVYGPCLLARSAKLVQRVQNACARFCFSIAPRSHVSPHINNANMLNMESRRKLHLATMLFGIISTGKPAYLHAKIKWMHEKSKYSVRFAPRIAMTRHRTAAFRGTFKHSASKIWNDLPPPARMLKSITSFKKLIKIYLLDRQKLRQ